VRRRFVSSRNRNNITIHNALQDIINGGDTMMFLRQVASVRLEIECPGKIFLLHTEALEKANHTSIAKLLDKALHLLWPQGIKYDNILLFLSDAAPYMCPARIQFFREKAPNISFPPQPVLTRWGTWLSAANYYCEHFETLKEIILGLNREDAISIEKAQDLMNDCDLKSDLIYIYSNFGTLSDSITRLETLGLSLHHSIKIVQDVENKIQQAENRVGQEIIKKLKSVLDKNTGFKTVTTISKMLNGEKILNQNFPDDLNNSDIAHFKFAPITSVDVERSFSKYKNLLSDNRRSFTIENIKHALIGSM
ncbi:DUF659 domain-containing protein, partial [Aphis craccivora]